MAEQDFDLDGKLLVAMPGMGDPRFDRSVILVCAHSPDGAMGLIINKPQSDLTFAKLLDHLNIPHSTGQDIRVHYGGPVERVRGFVLHSTDYPAGNGTMEIGGLFRMTATQDILQAMAAGAGPARAVVALGYSGWGPGQLESEILANGWLITDAPADLVFAADDSGKWTAALRLLGIDPLTLSASAGRA